ncbi:MAG: hypothetical protein ACREQQ_18305, partial [Candidatus Binatia bacterium]
ACSAIGRSPAGPTDDGARAALRAWLEQFPKAEQGETVALSGDPLPRLFPSRRFLAVRYRQYPVAISLPEPLMPANLFAVDVRGRVERIPDRTGLEELFRMNVAPVRSEREALDVLKAWLLLSPEFHQDGFFRFSIPADSLVVTEREKAMTARGEATVEPNAGNTGKLIATVTFDARGELQSVIEDVRLFAGPRPVCQATKLLDPDPVIRAMAEQTLLVMGSAAKSYLDEQRTSAGPDLERAIDRLWQRILAEGR